MENPYEIWIRLAEGFRLKRPLPIVGPEQEKMMVEILSPVLNLMKEFQEKGYVSEPRVMDVENGIGFVWIIPPGFRVAVKCVGPITRDGALVRIGISGAGFDWVALPTLTDLTAEGPKEVNKEGRYPSPEPDDPHGNLSHGRLLELIAKLVGDPVSRGSGTH